MSELIKSDQEYKEWISEISRRFRQYQIKAAVAVNSGMLAFYWSLGRDIVRMKAESRWGSSFYENLSIDLHNVLPQSSGFSPTNLRYMKRFYELYAPYVTTGIQQDDQYNAIQAQVVPELKKQKRAQVVPEIELGTIFSIPWGHHRNILVKCKGNPQKALFYIQQTKASADGDENSHVTYMETAMHP